METVDHFSTVMAVSTAAKVSKKEQISNLAFALISVIFSMETRVMIIAGAIGDLNAATIVV